MFCNSGIESDIIYLHFHVYFIHSTDDYIQSDKQVVHLVSAAELRFSVSVYPDLCMESQVVETYSRLATALVLLGHVACRLIGTSS